jgi:DivIVA domain-containing protein
MGDDQIVNSAGQAITPETVVSRSFSAAFRGYHPTEVRQFLKNVSDELAAAGVREVELRRSLQEALAKAAHPDLDEATLTTVLGEHAAKLLASARETAASITEDARRQADELVRDAESRVARMRHEADGLMARRVAEADASAASIQRAAEVEAVSRIEQATQQGKDMVAEARAVRERMLGDLSRRRRSAQLQIEQLRAARDRLVAAYDVVRRTVDEATAELDAAEPEARLAAEAVARRAEEVDDAIAAEQWSPPARPEREREPEPALVGAAAGPARRESRESPAPATSLFRRLDRSSLPPAPPERPHLRPQTVAGAAAGRAPAVPGPPPPAPRVPVAPPPEPPAMTAVSELATSEVPVVTADGPSNDVKELFARIRADRVGPDVDHAPPVAVEPPTPAPATLDPVVGESALEGRDELLDNVEAGLTRALKRVLGDEQNQVLDGLRRLGASAGLAVLPDPDTQTAGYRDAAIPWLQQAVRAGVGFVSDPPSGPEPEAATPPVQGEAGALARDLVEPLRDRLARALEHGADADDPAVTAESFRATYRQWKVEQVEAAARHHVVTAFNLGAFAATPDGAVLQWLVDDDGHCPDCDDNALAGGTAKGQPFPTGQLHPPAHPGCRCLLVPVPT